MTVSPIPEADLKVPVEHAHNVVSTREEILAELEEPISRAAKALMAAQKEDGHWIYEVESDATMPAQYVMLVHYLGETPDKDLERMIANYLQRTQLPGGGWPIMPGKEPMDINPSVQAYLALKLIGHPTDAEHMIRARDAILAAGGAEASNMFTRLLLVLFNVLPWDTMPMMPVEMMLLPNWFPVHVNKLSSWARIYVVPMLVVSALRPIARHRVHAHELFNCRPSSIGLPSRKPHQSVGWFYFFSAADTMLRLLEPVFPSFLRKRAVDAAVAFVDARMNGEEGLGGICPTTMMALIMYDALGYSPDHPTRGMGRRFVEKMLVVRDDEAYCQACASPTWDTAYAAHALLETCNRSAIAAAWRGVQWLLPRQTLTDRGDWALHRPELRPGGWAFEYSNPLHPDVDDTAVIVAVLHRASLDTHGSPYHNGFSAPLPDPAFDGPSVSTHNGHPNEFPTHLFGVTADASSTSTLSRHSDGIVLAESIARGCEWLVGMQSSDGGWGAFEAENTHFFLENIPFAEYGAMLDPPTVDVTGRCLSALAKSDVTGEPLRRAVDFILTKQETDGSWWGRWGINYIHGTWSALCGLNAAGFPHDDSRMRRAVRWLVSIQNLDGGWGEDEGSYKLDYRGHEWAPSNPTQTAWAVLGLMAAGEVHHPAVARGIAWLRETQLPSGLWRQELFTGVSFPRIMYFQYHGYFKYFPLWALARYRNLIHDNSTRVLFGM